MISFTIPGTPGAKARPRVRVIQPKGPNAKPFATMYSPAETTAYENLVKIAFRQVHYGAPSERPIKMTVKAFFPIPASATKRFHYECVNEDKPVVKKPDWDNIGKVISDALNGIAYKDDSQVYSSIVEKYYSVLPRTVVTIDDTVKLDF